MIRTIRIRAGLKQKEVASGAGISANYLSLIENGRKTPSLPVLQAIGDQLGVPAAMLMLHSSRIERDLDVDELNLLKTLRRLLDLMSPDDMLRYRSITDGPTDSDGASHDQEHR
jgi:transcriptional regulator with XRE-family HTH domain